MMKNVDKHPDLVENLGLLIVEMDVHTFLDARRETVNLRKSYMDMYAYVMDHWEKFDHEQQS